VTGDPGGGEESIYRARAATTLPPISASWGVDENGFFEIDTDGRPVDGNGRSRFRLLKLLQRLHRKDRNALLRKLAGTTGAGSFVLDVRYAAPKTGERWMRLSITSSDDGRRFNALAVDVTDLKGTAETLQVRLNALSTDLEDALKTKRKLEARSSILFETAHELERARAMAEEAGRVKAEFLSNVSHEFRTPLNAIIGFSEIISEQTFGPVGSRKYLEYASDIHMSGIHLLDLINDILDYSRFEAGVSDLQEDEVDVETAIRSVARMLREQADRAGVSLRTELAEELPRLVADARKIRQILLNLAANAIKFTDRGGSVSISAYCRPVAGFILEVADTGIGIAREDIPRVMTVFGQVENTMTRSREGTGLGLPLSRALAELHGATFDLKSEPGVGTVVKVTFPTSRIIDRSDSGDGSA
jgi:signal transduction histidine kinase